MANEQAIWTYLRNAGINACGVAGIMGNLYAESGLIPNNLEDTYNTKLGMTDAQYTAAVDNGTYTNFVHDSAGYGLAQWTWYSRKEALLKLAKSKGKSIADLNVQLEYLVKELSGMSGYTANIKNAASVSVASNFILINFERPLDQSQAMKNKRIEFSQKYYNQFAGTATTSATQQAQTSVTVTPATKYTGVMIGHASIDENGKASGGAAGDQTGKEVCVRTWYDSGWDVLLRPKTALLAEKMAAACEWLCNSNLVGYDQGQRNTLYNELEKLNWNYKQLKTKCETDCSALMGTCAKAAGSNVQRVYGNCCYTGNQKDLFVQSGDFTVITDTKYLRSNNYVKRGDVLLRTSGHTAMVLSDGPLAGTTGTPAATLGNATAANPYTEPTINVKQGSKGVGVQWAQYILYKAGYGVGTQASFVDGDFGPNTKTAVMKFQKTKGLEIDGIVGPATRAALKKVSI